MPFYGTAILTNGLTYKYTKDGKKILMSKPKPNVKKIVNNLWRFENPLNNGYKNGKFYPYTTANGNIDIGPGIDFSK